MQGLWEKEEVQALFKAVEKCKKEGKAIKEAFSSHAKRFARKANSVRNYYYHEVDNLEKDKERLNTLGINLEKHSKSKIQYFSQEEQAAVVEEIDKLRAQGQSVRKACLTMAGGNVELMLRYQNKYRNFVAKRDCEKKEEKMANIIEFKKPGKGLSDADVQSLFMGLVRLVKRNALIEGEERAKEKLSQSNERLKQALLQMQIQSREIDKMKERYETLKRQNNDLARSLMLSRCDKAEVLRKKISLKNGFTEQQARKI